MKSKLWATISGVLAVLPACVFLSRAEEAKTPGVVYQEGRTAVESLSAVEGRFIAPVEDGLFEIDVLASGQTLEKLHARGRRYVEAFAGAEYELRIRNPLGVRVAVALSVDGVNTIDARRSTSWDARKWVIEPYGTIRITGWQMSSARARKFYFTSERDSYASKIGRNSDLGLISAVFYREAHTAPVHVTPPPQHRDESRMQGSDRSGTSSESMNRAGKSKQGATAASPRAAEEEYAATGIGRSVENQVRWVNLELERRPAAEVSIRYEYRDTLYKLGVLPRPSPNGNALNRRERARGFEDSGYCPEP